MSGESYTRWRAQPSDDEDDEGVEGESRGGRGRGEAVTIITPSAPRLPHVLSHGGQIRLLCVMILMLSVCLVCVGLGVCVGLAWGYARSYRHTSEHIISGSTLDYMHVQRFLHSLLPSMIQYNMKELEEIPQRMLADFVEDTWEFQGLDTTTTTFRVHLSKPDTENPNTVEVTYSDGHKEVLNPLPPTGNPTPFSAYSPAGVVTGPLVYGRYGKREDLATLQSRKINLKGSILLLRHGKLHNGAKMHNAEQAGAVGVLFYPDPADMRGMFGGGEPYPNGTGLPDDGVIWSTVSTLPGDPATPFLPSLDYIYRTGQSSQTLPKIPGHTVSAEVAQQLLVMMDGPEAPEGWWGDLDLVYRLGGSWTLDSNVTNITLSVNNILHEKTLKNIHATLPAADESRVIMVGCHYGSLSINPGAGLGALLALSEAIAKNYLPGGTQRKLVFSAWAAGEYGMIGSTEFTQLYSSWVDSSVIAYLSVDEMLQGTGSLRVMASPTLRQAIREAATQVMWPVGEDVSVYDGWCSSDPLDAHFSNLGSGSDYVSFTAQRGVPSAHFVGMGVDWWSTFSLRHSQYDTRYSYTSLLDPDYKWTHMITSLVGAVMMVLSENELPPVVMTELSTDLYDGWRRFLGLHATTLHKSGYNFTGIIDAIEAELIRMNSSLSDLDRLYHTMPNYVHQYSMPVTGLAHYRQVEQRLRWLTNLERGLLGPRGVGRTFTTNLMVGPDLENPYRATHYPHAAQAIIHALLQKTPWESVHQELSYILAALTSYRQLFPIDVPVSTIETQDID
ncbi:aminopeptidase NAALADL1-like isoform X2 [Homarus americanus]|nr:aminopeptidase NAALADL1-like isoform X2 [Homarus americanus]